MNRRTKAVSSTFTSIVWLIFMIIIPYDFLRMVAGIQIVIYGLIGLVNCLPEKPIRDIATEIKYIVFRDKVKKGLIKSFEDQAPVERKGFFE